VSGAVSLATSVVALVVSVLVAWRQDRKTKSAGDFAAVLEVYLRDVRDKEYQNDQHYVVSRLGREHPQPGTTVSGLPETARNAVWNVAFLYESIGMMYKLGVMDRRIALGVFHFRIVQVWEAIAPFAQAERSHRDGPFLAFFENLYHEARALSPHDLLTPMALHTTPPRTPAPRTSP
jgi:hypothetical protein